MSARLHAVSPNLARVVIWVAAKNAMTRPDLDALVASLPAEDWDSSGAVNPVRHPLFAWEPIEIGRRRFSVCELLLQASWTRKTEWAERPDLSLGRALVSPVNEVALEAELEVPALVLGRRLNRKRSRTRDAALREVLERMNAGLVVRDAQKHPISEAELQKAQSHILELLGQPWRFLRVTSPAQSLSEPSAASQQRLSELRARVEAHPMTRLEEVVFAVDNGLCALRVRTMLSVSDFRSALDAPAPGFRIELHPVVDDIL